MKIKEVYEDKEDEPKDAVYDFVHRRINCILSDIVQCVKERREVSKLLVDELHYFYSLKEKISMKNHE